MNAASRELYEFLKEDARLSSDRGATVAAFPVMPPDYAYSGLSDFLVKHGRTFTPQPLPTAYRRKRRGECFENAYRLAKASKRKLHYVEGVAGVAMRFVHHAWCADSDDRVIEITWEVPWPAPAGLAYFGVVLPLETVEQTRDIRDIDVDVIIKTGKLPTNVFGDWARGFPIFKRPWRSGGD